MPSTPYAARAALHFGEEPCISGSRGSGTVFFSGCPLSCVFCQNREISRHLAGRPLPPRRLADIFRSLYEQGAHNINLVSPTPFIPTIRQALAIYRPPIPIVYNSSGYERVETLRSLEGLIDIYLPDFKYADDELAASLSGAQNYRQTALAAIGEMRRQTGELLLDENGIAVSGTLIRHLVLPGHIKNSLSALRCLRDAFSSSITVSLLFQYTPVEPLSQKELNRRLTQRECDKVFDTLCALGFENGYVQDLESASKDFIPAFDGTSIPV